MSVLSCPVLLCSLCFSHQIIFYCLLLGFASNQSRSKDGLLCMTASVQLTPELSSTLPRKANPLLLSSRPSSYNHHQHAIKGVHLLSGPRIVVRKGRPVLYSCATYHLCVSAHSSTASSSHHPVNNNIAADDKRRLKWKS